MRQITLNSSTELIQNKKNELNLQKKICEYFVNTMVTISLTTIFKQ